jgi:hypothetical protein
MAGKKDLIQKPGSQEEMQVYAAGFMGSEFEISRRFA